VAIFAFYSVKGGTSRTTLTANLGAMLARQGYRVGLVDADIEGSGLDIFLATAAGRNLRVEGIVCLAERLQQRYAKELTGTLVDVLLAEKVREDGTYWIPASELLSSGTAPHEQPELGPDGDLWLLPCGREWCKLARLRYTDKTAEALRQLLELMQKKLSLDHILVDCRSGVADSALVAALAADCLLMTVIPSNAHLLGAWDAVEIVEKTALGAPWCVKTQVIHYVASKVPPDKTTVQAIQGFFSNIRFHPSGLSFVPFHNGMTAAECIPGINGDQHPDDKAYAAALRSLWRDLEMRLASLPKHLLATTKGIRAILSQD